MLHEHCSYIRDFSLLVTALKSLVLSQVRCIFSPSTSRSLRLLPGAEPGISPSKRAPGSTSAGAHRTDWTYIEPWGIDAGGSAKYFHCVEESLTGGGGQGDEGGVVIEWARRTAPGDDVQEVLVKCRVGRFPSQKGFYLLVSVSSLAQPKRV